MTERLNAINDSSTKLSSEQVEECYELQECIELFTIILDELRKEYESGIAEGLNLPSYEELVRVN